MGYLGTSKKNSSTLRVFGFTSFIVVEMADLVSTVLLEIKSASLLLKVNSNLRTLGILKESFCSKTFV
jgi:hypothetical protein